MKINHLSKEKSPYLLQHKDNPVWWHPWGKEALELAKKENKPVFLSIGYSTCHWCHVMEHESFEKQEVADVLNKDFISVKVDREERPDVDDIYMGAVQRMTGQGGWPMSVWLTSEGKPFFGGTYFPKDRFVAVLNQITDLWKNNQAKLLEGAEKITPLIGTSEDLNSKNPLSKSINESVLLEFTASLSQRFDPSFGGFGGAPKFPPAMQMMAMMRVYKRTDNAALKEEIRIMVTETLRKMAYGGIYDHVGGGFSRYSTDVKWLVPHFEKMLYDNALLSMAYIEAYQLFNISEFKSIAEDIFNYVLRDMTHPDGGFYSAEDADSLDPSSGKKHEGHFYVFKPSEFRGLLTENEYKEIEKTFGLKEAGNFEGKNILNIQKGQNWENKKNPEIQSALKKIYEFRNTRPKPHLDDKILVAWNGLMIASLAKGYQVFKNPKYLEAAERSADFILSEMKKNGKLLRRWREGEARFPAYSVDYASLIHGLIHLFESKHDPKWLKEAIALQEKMRELFWDKEIGGYFRDDGSDKTLIARIKDDYDGVRPTANSLSVLNNLRLFDLTYEKKFFENAESVLQLFTERLEKMSLALPQMLIGLDYFSDSSKEVAIVGGADEKTTEDILSYLQSEYLPNIVVAYSKEPTDEVPLLKGKGLRGGKTTVYVCEQGTCKLPVNTLDEMKLFFAKPKLIRENRK